MWPLLLDLAVPIAMHSLNKFMEDDSKKHLQEYLKHLESRVQTLEKKVKALQITFLITGMLAVTGLVIFGVLYFF